MLLIFGNAMKKQKLIQNSAGIIMIILTFLGFSCTKRSLILFDFNRDFDTGTVETTEGMKISLIDEKALRLEKGAVRQYRPSLVLKAPGGKWDLSGYEAITIEVKNVGSEPHSVNCIINNPGDPPLPVGYVYEDTDVITEGALLLWPGEEGVLKLPLLREQWAEKEIGIIGMRGHPPVKRVKDLSNVNQLVVYIQKADKPFEVVIDNIRAEGIYKAPEKLQELKNFFPMIDEFGQYRHREWSGKTHSQEELLVHREIEEGDLDSHPGPESWDKYGGWAAGPQLEATGFFRVEKHQGKWWLVDPEGRLFWSHGIVAVEPYHKTAITDREYMYSFLPSKDEPLGRFYGTASTRWGYYSRYDTFETYSYTKANMYRIWGEDWFDKSAGLAHHRLKSWGMNTMHTPNWDNREIYELRKTPYTGTLRTRQARRIIGDEVSEGSRFPDPFDPSFRRILRDQLAYHKGHSIDDPWCIGYHIDGEPDWGWDGISLAVSTLKSPPDQAAKREFINDLKLKYSSIDRLNTAWGTSHGSWGALLMNRTEPEGEGAYADLRAFYAKLADTYFRICKEELKSAAPNQLYFGCRFWSVNIPVADAAAKYCDVVGYNRYYYTVENFYMPSGQKIDTLEYDKPMLFGEWHVGALDRGMLHPSLRQTKDQDQRAKAYKDYVLGAMRHPQAVGTIYFQYQDQETTGRVGDGENYQIGFIDVCNKPYYEIIRASRDVGYNMYDYRFSNK